LWDDARIAKIADMANPKRLKLAERWNPAKEFEQLNVVKLEDALLCANCELIVSETLKGKCPVCGSSALLGLCRLLGGPLDGGIAKPAATHLAGRVHPIDQRVEGERMDNRRMDDNRVEAQAS
jgi:hypothetical protein